MPLLSATRQEAPPGAQNLASLKQTDEIFVVGPSGEAVKNYGDLLDKQHAYSLATWTDRYYGRSKLTYQEALTWEKHAEKQLRAQVPTKELVHSMLAGAVLIPCADIAVPVPQFPKHLEGEAVKLIHHSVLRKDDLVNKLYETIKASKTGDEDQKPAADQQQQQLPAEAAAQAANVTKKLLTHFLIYVGAFCASNDVDSFIVQLLRSLTLLMRYVQVADKQKPGVWVCKDPWVQKYGLAAELPSNLQTASVPASESASWAKCSMPWSKCAGLISSSINLQQC